MRKIVCLMPLIAALAATPVLAQDAGHADHHPTATAAKPAAPPVKPPAKPKAKGVKKAKAGMAMDCPMMKAKMAGSEAGKDGDKTMPDGKPCMMMSHGMMSHDAKPGEKADPAAPDPHAGH